MYYNKVISLSFLFRTQRLKIHLPSIEIRKYICIYYHKNTITSFSMKHIFSPPRRNTNHIDYIPKLHYYNDNSNDNNNNKNNSDYIIIIIIRTRGSLSPLPLPVERAHTYAYAHTSSIRGPPLLIAGCCANPSQRRVISARQSRVDGLVNPFVTSREHVVAFFVELCTRETRHRLHENNKIKFFIF